MRKIILLASLAALTGGIASAATLPEDFPLEGTLHWGPFRVRPFLLLKDTGYDSNVFLEDSEPTSDFTSTGEAGIRMFSLFRDRGVIQIEERLDYVWYAQNAELNHFNNAFASRGAYYMRKGFLFAELSGLSFRERPSTEIDFRVRRNERVYGTGWRFTWPHSALQFRIGRDTFVYDSGTPGGDSIPLFLNRAEDRFTLTASRKILPKTLFLVEGEGRRIGFYEPEGQINDSRSRRISAGFQFDPSAFIQGGLKVGIENLVPDEANRLGYDGLVGDANVVYRITGLTSLEGRWRRNVEFTTAVENVYYLDRAYGATLTQFLAERVAGELGIDREKVEYPVETSAFDSNTGQLVTGLRVDEFRSFFVGGWYRFSNLTRIGLRVGEWERNSTFEFLNRHRMTVAMTYSYNF